MIDTTDVAAILAEKQACRDVLYLDLIRLQALPPSRVTSIVIEARHGQLDFFDAIILLLRESQAHGPRFAKGGVA